MELRSSVTSEEAITRAGSQVKLYLVQEQVGKEGMLGLAECFPCSLNCLPECSCILSDCGKPTEFTRF
jgi:hypothetical protein